MDGFAQQERLEPVSLPGRHLANLIIYPSSHPPVRMQSLRRLGRRLMWPLIKQMNPAGAGAREDFNSAVLFSLKF